MLTRVAGIQATLLPVALFWGEYYTIPATVASVVLVHAVGKPLVVGCTTDEDISEAEVFISAESAWFVAAAAGTLPFLGIAWTAPLGPRRPLDPGVGARLDPAGLPLAGQRLVRIDKRLHGERTDHGAQGE